MAKFNLHILQIFTFLYCNLHKKTGIKNGKSQKKSDFSALKILKVLYLLLSGEPEELFCHFLRHVSVIELALGVIGLGLTKHGFLFRKFHVTCDNLYVAVVNEVYERGEEPFGIYVDVFKQSARKLDQ